MPIRPYWTGQVQISLVQFGVKLYVATEAKSEIHFHQLSRKTGQRTGLRTGSYQDQSAFYMFHGSNENIETLVRNEPSDGEK